MKDKYTISAIAEKNEAFVLQVSLYKKLIAETLQLVETLGLTQGQESAIKSFIKKNFYSYLNEVGLIVDIEEIYKLVYDKKLTTSHPIYNE